MDRYPLIKSLQDKTDKTPLPKGHTYVEYKVVIENEEIIVNIPTKEADAFEATLEATDGINKYDFKQIMRKFRGIRG